MTYWPYIVNWILPSSSSESSDYHENNVEDEEETDQSPNDIDSVVSPSAIIPCDPSSSSSKRRRIEENDEELITRTVSQKRVWTKEDEFKLLHGFLDYTSKRREATKNNNDNIINGRNPKDQVSPFFEAHVGPELKLKFSKNQIVDKLRRLKRKYRNISARNNKESSLNMGFSFKSSHEKETFELCREIWKINNNGGDDSNTTCHLGEKKNVSKIVKITSSTRRSTRSSVLNSNNSNKKKKKKKKKLKDEDEQSSDNTVELVMELGLNSYVVDLMRYGDQFDEHNKDDDGDEDYVDEKWKEEKIMELEAYLKRLDMVQTKLKASLDKLRSKLD